MTVTDHIVIEERFRGPPGSANGGYTCGRLAQYLENPAQVTLRNRPPLGQVIDVDHRGDEVHLMHGSTVIAEGAAAEPRVQVPPGVTFDEATEASVPVAPEDHPYPECFVCGPLRGPRDGLRIYPGKVEGRDLFAAPWVPDKTLARDDAVPAVFLWAALDCPSGFGASLLGPHSPILLGRLSAQILEPVAVGERLVVVGWPIGREGRKLFGGTAVLSEQGDVKGFSRATWIELR